MFQDVRAIDPGYQALPDVKCVCDADNRTAL
jgi:hypothetical protein